MGKHLDSPRSPIHALLQAKSHPFMPQPIWVFSNQPWYPRLGFLKPKYTQTPGKKFRVHETHFHMCELRCRSSMELSAEQNRSSRRLNT